jgi:glycosyltransferase involved in cell wall biosynthesis
MSVIAQLTSNRTIIGDYDNNIDVQLTVVVSFYNAEKFVMDRLEEIKNQSSKQFRLLIIDNGSSDQTWNQILKYAPSLTNVILVKSPVNFGGTGTTWFNRDLINTEWFTSIHQDDSYKANHLETFISRFGKISDEVVALSNDMGRVQTNELFTSHPPRGIWFQRENDQATAFLANLRKHQIPWGGTAFRTEIYWKCLCNWHSPTFPDTEIILKMCSYGIFENTGQETMFYLENDSSESHDLASKEQELGIAISLLRVFHSSEFKRIVGEVKTEDLPNFQESILKNLEYRFGRSIYLDILQNSVNDQLLNFTGYSNIDVLNMSFEQAFLSDLEKGGNILANVAGVSVDVNPIHMEDSSKKKNSTLLYLLGILPYRARKVLFKRLVEIELKIFGKSNWDFRWKD